MKKNKKRNIIILIYIISMTLTVVSFRFMFDGILRDNIENNHRAVSGLICNAIDNAFLKPITVAETMSRDLTTKEIVGTSSKQEEMANEKNTAKFLKSLRDGFGYSMVFAINEKTKAYFTPDGFSRYVNPDAAEDYWYNDFINSGQNYKLDVDTDEAANWALSVFVNSAVYDDDNKLIGICGVGVSMHELQKLLEHYERIYDVKINVINSDGLIQIDTDEQRIEKDYIFVESLSDYADDECYYEILPNGGRTIMYLESLEWFLVIENSNSSYQAFSKMAIPYIICLLAGILLIYGGFAYIEKK